MKGGWVNNLNTGFVWENRDSEFDPTKGNRAELEVRFAPGIISEYSFTTARLELRQYFQLFNWITFANKLEARHAAGDVPFWELSTLGDAYTLRGYPLNRFKGNSSLAYTLELRTWLIEFPELYNLKFGGQLFTDTGRVFTGQDDINDLFEGYKQTIGFGGAMSVFTPDFILRGDIGFSEDVTRIYIGVGYLF
nr:BamA/TamA family outer membrane protein [Fodinibius halophilus]